MSILFILFFLFFVLLAWTNFRLATAFFIMILPAYLIRTSFGPLPTTLLEVSFGAIFLVWLMRHSRADFPQLKKLIKEQRFIFIGALLFLLSSLIAALANPYLFKALGIWRAYFLEPILIFLVLAASAQRISAIFLSASLVLSTLSISVLTIWQKMMGTLYPPSLWDDQLFGRPTSFFTSPNAIGLYIVPILFLVAAIFSKIKIDKRPFGLTAFIGLLAIALSLSQGSWVALAVGLITLLFALSYKKIAAGLMITGVVLAFYWPSLQQALLFQDQAGQNRLTIWKYSAEYLTASPFNFVLGSGLRRFFTEVQKPHYDQAQMERLIYPHNIFLNFWLETGFAGMASFVLIIASLFSRLRKKFIEDIRLRASLIASLTALIIHGLVDVPYFKNDLAMLFWIIAAIVVLASKEKQTAAIPQYNFE